ncbi:MAG: hypothetical protein HC890_02525 [Chloroflexaceae bacterium]|nr:hypothetical protein [Chloroflexaceae bacterium]
MYGNAIGESPSSIPRFKGLLLRFPKRSLKSRTSWFAIASGAMSRFVAGGRQTSGIAAPFLRLSGRDFV